jgi:tetratricopeptide (TPR) repeat protein
MGTSIRSSVLRAVVIAWLSVGFAHAAVVRGLVLGAGGEAVSEAVVSLVPADDNGVKVSAASNRTGAFLFGAVRPGRYEVRVEAAGMVLAYVEGSARTGGKTDASWRVDESPRPDAPVVVAIAEGHDVEFRLRVEAGLTLGGKTLTAAQALDSALTRIQAGDCSRGEEELSALLQVDPEIPKAHYLRGFCRGSRGDVEGALEALDRTLALKPGYPGAALLKAQILAGAKRIPEAETAFRAEIAAAGRPQLVRDAWWGLGLLLRDAGRVGDALGAFEQAAGGGKPEAWIEVAEMRRSGGDLPGAEQALVRAAEAGAPVARPLLNLGVSLFNEKRYPDAIRVFREASESDDATPADAAMAFGLLGKALLASGKPADARAALERSLEIAPRGEFSEEARKLLEEAGR